MATIFNVCEGIFWLAIGLAIVVKSRSSPRPLQRLGLATGVAFLAFAGTDFIEAKTGAWYQPPWLLVYNTVCIAVLIACFFRHRVLLKRMQQ